jgi:hypothetical protein
MKLIRLASYLPDRFLRSMAKYFDTPGAFELPELGSAFWMDASYHKYVRKDKKRNPNRYDSVPVWRDI